MAPGASPSREKRFVDITTIGVGIAVRLCGNFVRGTLLSIVAATALWRLGLARPVARAAFTTAFASIGIAFALAVGLRSARAVQAAWERLMGRRGDE